MNGGVNPHQQSARSQQAFSEFFCRISEIGSDFAAIRMFHSALSLYKKKIEEGERGSFLKRSRTGKMFFFSHNVECPNYVCPRL